MDRISPNFRSDWNSRSAILVPLRWRWHWRIRPGRSHWVCASQPTVAACQSSLARAWDSACDPTDMLWRWRSVARCGCPRTRTARMRYRDLHN